MGARVCPIAPRISKKKERKKGKERKKLPGEYA